MSTRPTNTQLVSDPLRETIDDWIPKLSWISGVVTLAALAYLIYVVIGITGPNAVQLAKADVSRLADVIGFAGKIYLAALSVLCLALIAMVFHEAVAGPIMIFGAALIYWGIPLIITVLTEGKPVGNQHLYELGLNQIRLGALVAVLPGVGLALYSLISATAARGMHGVKKDQLVYGKDVKEEPEVVNRFLGKCWQLPYCRKFIRLKCPIYLSKKCCWRERVGCMCEEAVIRDAMEGTTTIPKDPVAAAQYIPYNKTLTPAMKAERCRNCIIYNEHQRQKYRLVVPLLLLGTIGPVAMFHDTFQERLGMMLDGLDKVVARFSVVSSNAPTDPNATGMFQSFKSSPLATEVLLISILVIVLAYLLRGVEYALFKLKI